MHLNFLVASPYINLSTKRTLIDLSLSRWRKLVRNLGALVYRTHPHYSIFFSYPEGVRASRPHRWRPTWNPVSLTNQLVSSPWTYASDLDSEQFAAQPAGSWRETSGFRTAPDPEACRSRRPAVELFRNFGGVHNCFCPSLGQTILLQLGMNIFLIWPKLESNDIIVLYFDSALYANFKRVFHFGQQNVMVSWDTTSQGTATAPTGPSHIRRAVER